MRDKKRRLSIKEKEIKIKIKHLSEPGYSDSSLPLHWHEDPPCLCPCSVFCVWTAVWFFFLVFFFFLSVQVCVWANKPGAILSTPPDEQSRWLRPPGSDQPFKKQALGTPTTIGKALYWSSSFKMQHRIKGYMLLHVTHNKVSRIFTSIVLRIDLLSNQICIDKSQRKIKW